MSARSMWKQNRLEALLAVLLILFAAMPFLENSVYADVIASTMLLVAASAGADKKGHRAWALALGGLAIFAIWLAHWKGDTVAVITSNLLELGLFLLVTAMILSQVFRARRRRITREAVAGAACAYLLIAVVWSSVFRILDQTQPGSFSAGPTASDANAPDPHHDRFKFTYFSFVTLTTLGYGDIVPLTRPARTFAALEAISGQLYVAILIAGLVGQHTHPRTREDA